MFREQKGSQNSFGLSHCLELCREEGLLTLKSYSLLKLLEIWLCFSSRYSLMLDDKSVVAKASTGSPCRPSHMGSRSNLCPRLGSRPLHPHIPDKIFPHDMLCGPWHQRRIRCRQYVFPESKFPLLNQKLGPETFLVGGSLSGRVLRLAVPLQRSKTDSEITIQLSSAHV